jgi:hypothetical protein
MKTILLAGFVLVAGFNAHADFGAAAGIADFSDYTTTNETLTVDNIGDISGSSASDSLRSVMDDAGISGTDSIVSKNSILNRNVQGSGTLGQSDNEVPNSSARAFTTLKGDDSVAAAFERLANGDE